MVVQRPKITRAHVVLTRPHEFDRLAVAHCLCHPRRLHNVIGMRIAAAPERAAGVQGMDGHALGLDIEGARDGTLIAGQALCAVPQLATSGRDLGNAVHGLHGGVSEEGELVLGLDDLRGLRERRRRIAAQGRNLPGCRRELPVLGQELRRAELERVAFVPIKDQGVAALIRAPEIARDHGNAGVERGDLLDTADLLRRGGVERLQHGAEARRMRDHRRQHVGQVDVLRVHRRAVDLGWDIGARHVAPDVDEFLG